MNLGAWPWVGEVNLYAPPGSTFFALGAVISDNGRSGSVHLIWSVFLCGMR